jgi:hypothetical protein
MIASVQWSSRANEGFASGAEGDVFVDIFLEGMKNRTHGSAREPG